MINYALCSIGSALLHIQPAAAISDDLEEDGGGGQEIFISVLDKDIFHRYRYLSEVVHVLV